MWFLFALSSAVLLGFYDVFKKQSLSGNAVIPVLFANTVISSLIFLPLIVAAPLGYMPTDSHWYVPAGTLSMHLWVVLKAIIVLSSWVCGYFAIKHLPLTVVGPINATRPVMTLVGALLLFGEHLNPWQWAGVVVAIVAFFMMSRSGKKEGLDFAHNRWVLLLIAAAVFGAVSGLYDKYLLAPAQSGGRGIPAVFVQSWFNVYQMLVMGVAFTLWRRFRNADEHFQWRWTIVGISLFLCAADMCYFYALSFDGALIAVVSMTRRSSVLVSFLFGAFLLKERNVKSKALDLLLVLVSLVLLCLGAK
ncbi:MAG: EamA family transporter [Bacteroidales bacterium]|nr:EamA family transporter [Bacteroidales bacterium]